MGHLPLQARIPTSDTVSRNIRFVHRQGSAFVSGVCRAAAAAPVPDL